MRISDWSSDVCSSDLLEWSFARREKVLFFPDQHLGRNTAKNMGIGLDEMIVWDFTKPLGGNTPEQIKAARMILWRGFCSVHQLFQPVNLENFRKRVPHGTVISHPIGRSSGRKRVCQYG